MSAVHLPPLYSWRLGSNLISVNRNLLQKGFLKSFIFDWLAEGQEGSSHFKWRTNAIIKEDAQQTDT